MEPRRHVAVSSGEQVRVDEHARAAGALDVALLAGLGGGVDEEHRDVVAGGGKGVELPCERARIPGAKAVDDEVQAGFPQPR